MVCGDVGSWAYFPLDHHELIGGNRIVSVVPLGVQPILDMKVASTECYFAAGVVHHNTGKTILGSYETAVHVTGLYPDWWTGLRFDCPIVARVCGDTRETVRDITQAKLLGPFVREGSDALGTGMIPRSLIGRPKLVQNTNGSVDFVPIRHVSGDWSTIEFRAYEQGRKAFQGTERHWIWEDEEPPQVIHEENVHRTRGVDVRVLLTYTPLSGFTDVVDNFLKWEKANKDGASRYTVFCGWDDVPHLSEDWKRQTLAETKPHMRKTRKSGVPLAGVGMVYPVEEDLFTVRPFEIPSHWRRVFGFDHGWHNTAACWFAWDKDEDVLYLYSEYKRGEVSLEQHSIAIKSRGEWIPGVGDVAQRESDGKKIIDKYKALGVRIKMADKAVDAGIQEVFSRLETGRLKVFSTCGKWLDEYRRYRYDEKQRIVKENDHLMDATRYVCNGGLKLATNQPSRGGLREIISNLSF